MHFKKGLPYMKQVFLQSRLIKKHILVVLENGIPFQDLTKQSFLYTSDCFTSAVFIKKLFF